MQTSEKMTALIYSTSRPRVKDNSKIIHFLIQKGADINAQEIYGNTALIYAVRDTNSDADYMNNVKALVESGADLNIEDGVGRRALFYSQFNRELSNYLRSKGAK